MDPPPPPPTNPIPAAIPHHTTYADSVESSPRSRTTETWDDRESLTGGGPKLRLMCSYGGHIIPRPHDKSLSYVGGDTRMVVVDRNISLSELKARLSRNLLKNQAFLLKYQLPNEDLDALISVTSDEDLENMIDEFDRICSGSSVAKSSRLRVFLFTNKGESVSSIESILDGSVKSEDWFFNALNGSNALGVGDAKSVNSLLGLASDSGSVRNAVMQKMVDLSKNHKMSSYETQLGSDSVMADNSSSFGSTTSSLANLPPIRVRVEGGGGGNRVLDQRVAVEEQFAQMSVSAGGRQADGLVTMVSPPPPIPTTLIHAAVAPAMSVGESPERIVDDDETSDQGVTVGYVMAQAQPQPQLQTRPQLQAQRQQNPSGIFDIASPGSTSSDGTMIYPEQVAQLPSGISRVTSNPLNSSNPRMQGQQKASESGYSLHTQLDQQQLQQQLQQLQNQQQLHQQNQQHLQNQQQHQQNQQHHQNQQQHQQNQQHHQQQQQQHHQQQQQHNQHQQHQQQQEHLQQQQQQQQEHLQQQQQQQNQQQHQQQHQQQQFVHPGTQYIQHPHNAVPISQYYNLYTPPTTQRPQPQIDQNQYPFYFIPPTARQPQQPYNMTAQQASYSEPSNATPSSHPQTPSMSTNPSAYNNQPRNVATAQAMVQLAPGQHQQQYMTYSQVHPAPQSMPQPQNPAAGANSSYAYEYADPAHAQIYSTQPLAHPAQYQTMVSSSQMVMLSDASSTQNPGENMKRQSSTQSE